MESTDSFFDQPQGGDGPGFVVNGRYAIKHPDTGRDTTWQRASNFAAPLSDHHAIARWQMRELIRGLNLREDLIELVRTATELDNATIDKWITAAHEAAAIDAKANRGTAVHEVLRAYDAGMQYSERYSHIVHGYGSELDRNGLIAVGLEVVVLNAALGAAGRLDRVYRERDDAYVLGDIKTGRLDYAVHDFAVQLAVYNTAKYLVDDQGNTRPLPWVLRQDYAVLVHVDPVTGESSTYRIDMTLGRRAANLAIQVRAWRNTKDVALPYVPPDVHASAADLARVVEADVPPAGPEGANPLNPVQVANLAGPGDGPRAGMPASDAGRMASPHVPAIGEERIRPDGVTVYWTGQDWKAAPADGTERTVNGVRQVFQVGEWMDLPPFQQPGHPGPRGAERMSEPPAIDPEVEAAELAKLPKTELQRMLTALGGTDLAHHRAWLANEIVKRKNAAGQPDIVTVGTNAAGERAVTIDQRSAAPVPAAEQTPHTLALIGAAGSVADLARIRDKVVSVGGDKAWTDEMTEAARSRAAVLDEGDRQSVLARIDTAAGSQELAALWAELTLSGTAPSEWTAEYQDRATARLAAINAANVAAPPVNPFAQQ